jgi:hypothetical protein
MGCPARRNNRVDRAGETITGGPTKAETRKAGMAVEMPKLQT